MKCTKTYNARAERLFLLINPIVLWRSRCLRRRRCLSSLMVLTMTRRTFREQGWRSGESTRLPPMWFGFDSRTRRHMWVEFVVGSRPCSEGFSPGSPVFLPPQKPTLLNSNSTWNARTRLNEFLELFGASWVNKLHYILQASMGVYGGGEEREKS